MSIRIDGTNTTANPGITGGDADTGLQFGTDEVSIVTGGTEQVKVDSSGRLLVGTSTPRSNVFSDSSGPLTPQNQIETQFNNYSGGLSLINNSASGFSPVLTFGQSFTNTLGGNGLTPNDEPLGVINFTANDGTNFRTGALIKASADNVTGSGDVPGRLTFHTTADGASSPTERMRIDSSGDLLFAQITTADPAGTNTPGFAIQDNGTFSTCRDGYASAIIGRKQDGNLVQFHSAGPLEGTISVSGSTVSYNGAHLSRWSQLPGGVERTEILRGSVLSNLDEMCEWGDEDNEQLNRMKVSDVEGDVNVSGVFQAWDDDDDTYTNDFYCAMTGDFIIRIAQGVTVQRGDLLMSAGDGTAKPQDDDIIRSKTIAKVTSTNVSCTYDDGSYCVPCVLMAC